MTAKADTYPQVPNSTRSDSIHNLEYVSYQTTATESGYTAGN